ncbi:hypothetical protein SASPL_129826 [Salvia splendens]|uniref:Uncharacterized protein n=1 Tax=Salvia splendens TaxID=180675 RepID=A0A8X8XF50_SALSN|nr:hypothetical protein SASPL_129826 [Salvia splendens]
MMSNGVGWSGQCDSFRLLSHFYVCWSEFVAGNLIELVDFPTFTLVDVGTFNVKRYDTKTGLVSVEFFCYPDVNTSDDYEPSETQTDSSDDDNYVEDKGKLATDEYPEFVVKMTRSHSIDTFPILATPCISWPMGKHGRLSSATARPRLERFQRRQSSRRGSSLEFHVG